MGYNVYVNGILVAVMYDEVMINVVRNMYDDVYFEEV